MFNMKWITIGLILAVVLLVLTPAAMATTDGYVSEAPAIEQPPPWIAIVFSVVGLAAIAVVGFKNPNRTHLD